MSERSAIAWAAMCVLLAACGETGTTADDSATVKLPRATATAEAAEESASPAGPRMPGSSRYTSLEPASCKLLEKNVDEGSYWRRRCAGHAGYFLETTDGNQRQDVLIVAPSGRRSQLNLSSLVAQGAFNSLGKTAEWRSRAPGHPSALIVRLDVAADPQAGRRRISNLVVARLDAPACVVAVVPRGPGQNEKARAIADGKLPACLKPTTK